MFKHQELASISININCTLAIVYYSCGPRAKQIPEVPVNQNTLIQCRKRETLWKMLKMFYKGPCNLSRVRVKHNEITEGSMFICYVLSQSLYVICSIKETLSTLRCFKTKGYLCWLGEVRLDI